MNFVLIPGSWTGPWIWESVTRGLHELGHQAYPVELTGLRASYPDVGRVHLETHVNDVISHIERKDLREVIVVGHTCTGSIAAVVADRISDRVVHTVLVETFVPQDGRSVLDVFPEALRAGEERLIAKSGQRWPVPDVSVFSDGQDLTPGEARWLVERCVPHPGRALTDPITLKHPLAEQHGTYVFCTKEHFDGGIAREIEELRALPNWDLRTLDTGLWPMVSVPHALARLLDDVAASGR